MKNYNESKNNRKQQWNKVNTIFLSNNSAPPYNGEYFID